MKLFNNYLHLHFSKQSREATGKTLHTLKKTGPLFTMGFTCLKIVKLLLGDWLYKPPALKELQVLVLFNWEW